MYPEDFQRLFETIECSEDDTCKWLYDEFYGGYTHIVK